MFAKCLKSVSAFSKNEFRRHLFCHNVNHSKLYEPDYLETMKPLIPEYYPLLVQLKGYDFAVLERFQSYVHNITDYLDIHVENSWGFPAQQFKVQRFKPHSAIVDAEYKLPIYERNLKIIQVSTPKLSTFLNIVITALPAGVRLKVLPFDDEHENSRYIPNYELINMQKELEELGGPIEES